MQTNSDVELFPCFKNLQKNMRNSWNSVIYLAKIHV